MENPDFSEQTERWQETTKIAIYTEEMVIDRDPAIDFKVHVQA